MTVRVGDVVRLFDGATNPPKYKRFLCVCVADGWFLRINSKPIWTPHLLLRQADNPACLDHDSYLELRGVIEYDDSEIQSALRYPDNHFGRLSQTSLRALATLLPTVKTLTAEERAQILSHVTPLL